MEKKRRFKPRPRSFRRVKKQFHRLPGQTQSRVDDQIICVITFRGAVASIRNQPPRKLGSKTGNFGTKSDTETRLFPLG